MFLTGCQPDDDKDNIGCRTKIKIKFATLQSWRPDKNEVGGRIKIKIKMAAGSRWVGGWMQSAKKISKKEATIQFSQTYFLLNLFFFSIHLFHLCFPDKRILTFRN